MSFLQGKTALVTGSTSGIGLGIAKALAAINANSLTNIRLYFGDASELLDWLPGRGLSRIDLLYPDPWPKKRHHKRRLIQPPLVAQLARKLGPSGYLHLATDWEEYAHQMLEVLSSEPLLENTAPGFTSRPAGRPETKFEARGLKLGHQVNDLVFRRRDGRDFSEEGKAAGGR